MAEELTPCEAYSPISDVDTDQWWEQVGAPERFSLSMFQPVTDHGPKLRPATPLSKEEMEKEAQLEAEMRSRLQRELDEGDRLRQSLYAEINLPPWLADPGRTLDDYEAEFSNQKSEKPVRYEPEQHSRLWEDYKSQNQYGHFYPRSCSIVLIF